MTDFFSRQQSSPSFRATVASYARLLFRSDTPWTVKGILILAILYLISPFDLVPDWIVGFGLLDDLAIVSFLVWWAIRLATHSSEVQSEKQK